MGPLAPGGRLLLRHHALLKKTPLLNIAEIVARAMYPKQRKRKKYELRNVSNVQLTEAIKERTEPRC